MLSSRRQKWRSVSCAKCLVACFVLTGIWWRQNAVTLRAELLWLPEMHLQHSAAINLWGHTCTCKVRRMPAVCNAKSSSTVKESHWHWNWWWDSFPPRVPAALGDWIIPRRIPSLITLLEMWEKAVFSSKVFETKNCGKEHFYYILIYGRGIIFATYTCYCCIMPYWMVLYACMDTCIYTYMCINKWIVSVDICANK